MQNLQIFNFNENKLRTVLVDNEPYFVGKDVAELLGYSNTRKAISDHVDEEDKIDGVTIRDSIGRKQMPTFINESGVYSLVFGSKLPQAKEFKRWVTKEVLPTLRKTGSYQMPKTTREKILLLLESQEETNTRIDELENKVEQKFDEMPLFGVDQDEIRHAINVKAIECLGGKESNAYADNSIRGKVYSDIHGQIRREFDVDSYKAIQRNKVKVVLSIVRDYKLPISLSETIASVNNQQSMNLS